MKINLLRRLRRDEKGATAVEYGLIVSLVVLAIMGAIIGFASKTIAMWEDIKTQVVK